MLERQLPLSAAMIRTTAEVLAVPEHEHLGSDAESPEYVQCVSNTIVIRVIRARSAALRAARSPRHLV
jgi:hypothetical protein